MITEYADTLQNVLLAAGIAFLFVISRHVPALGSIMLPFYKRGDCTKAGFIPFREALQSFGMYRGIAYSRLIVPVFATIYLVVLILRESQTPGSTLVDPVDFYFIVGVWALVILMTGQPLLKLLTIGLPFLIGFWLTKTVYGGCIAAAVVLAYLYAVSYEEHYAYDLVLNKVETEVGVRLDGSRSRSAFAKLGYLLRVLAPIFMLITIFRIVLNSNFSSSDFVLTYTESTSPNLISALFSLIISINISFRLFSRKIYSYLQIDFLKILGERLLYSKEHPEEFNEEERLIGERPDTPHGSADNVPLISSSDRLYQLKNLPISTFSTVMSFYALDLILTLSTQLSFPIIPGTTNANIATLSTLIKIPLYIVFISNSARRFVTLFSPNLNFARESATYREELREQRQISDSLEELLISIIRQQIVKKDYIDISGNNYLLTLAGMDTWNENRRIHI